MKTIVNISFFCFSVCTKHWKRVYIFLISAQNGKYNKQGNQNEIMNLISIFLIVRPLPTVHFCCVATLSACSVYSLVPLIANYVFNKASVRLIHCSAASRGSRLLGQISRTFLSLHKCTNIYGNRTEPALTVGQAVVSQSEPWDVQDFYSPK